MKNLKSLIACIAAGALLAAPAAMAQGVGQLAPGEMWANFGGAPGPAKPTQFMFPQFNAGNPANAALYVKTPNAPGGYATIYNGLQVSLGDPIPASLQFGSNTIGLQQAIVGTLSMAAGDTSAPGYAVIGYANSDASASSSGAVGIGGSARPKSATGAGTSLWGANFFASNNYSPNGGTGVNLNWLSGQEINVGVNLKAGGIEPVIGQMYGIYLIGSGDSPSDQGVGVSVNRLSIGTNARWNVAFESTAGAAVAGLRLNQTGVSGSSLDSQPLVFRATAVGGGILTAKIYEDLGGNLDLISSTGAQVKLGDDVTTVFATNPGGAGAKLIFPALNLAGIVQNDTSGNISSVAQVPVSKGGTGLSSGAIGGVPYFNSSSTMASSAALAANALVIGGGAGAAPSTTTTGTGILAALGGNIGSAGAPVLFNGAGGTPSSITLTNAGGFPYNTGGTGQVPLANGGTGQNLTASNGGIFYSGSATGAILAGTATARQMLQSGASAAPAWSTATWPATTTANQLLYSSATNTVGGLATANSSVLVTDGSGVPSLSTTLPNIAHGTPSSITLTNASGTASSLTAGNATNTAITDDTTTNATMFLTWVTGNTGNLPQKVTSTKLKFNPSTGQLSSTSFRAGNGSTNGLIFENSGGSPDAKFYEGAGGAFNITMGTADAMNMTTSGGTAVIDYNVNVVNGLSLGPALLYWTTATADTAATDATVCRRTSNGQLLTGTGASGVCLGTSSARFKHGITNLVAGLPEIMKLIPKNFYYKEGYGDSGAHLQYGFIAEEVIKTVPTLARRDEQGRPSSVDMLAMVPVLVKAVQELKADNDNLKTEFERRSHR